MAVNRDMGYMGSVDLGNTLRLSLQCVNGSDVPTTPDAAPTWAIYDDDDDTSVQTGSLDASDADSKTGFRRGNVVCSAANGFASGKRYTVRFEYDHSSGTNAAAVGHFMVN